MSIACGVCGCFRCNSNGNGVPGIVLTPLDGTTSSTAVDWDVGSFTHAR
jgi:hypothetical protein